MQKVESTTRPWSVFFFCLSPTLTYFITLFRETHSFETVVFREAGFFVTKIVSYKLCNLCLLCVFNVTGKLLWTTERKAAAKKLRDFVFSRPIQKSPIYPVCVIVIFPICQYINLVVTKIALRKLVELNKKIKLDKPHGWEIKNTRNLVKEKCQSHFSTNFVISGH